MYVRLACTHNPILNYWVRTGNYSSMFANVITGNAPEKTPDI